jgi:hypothetical protein
MKFSFISSSQANYFSYECDRHLFDLVISNMVSRAGSNSYNDSTNDNFDEDHYDYVSEWDCENSESYVLEREINKNNNHLVSSNFPYSEFPSLHEVFTPTTSNNHRRKKLQLQQESSMNLKSWMKNVLWFSEILGTN